MLSLEKLTPGAKTAHVVEKTTRETMSKTSLMHRIHSEKNVATVLHDILT